MISRFLESIATLFFRYIRLTIAFFITLFLLPPTFLYCCLPSQLIPSVHPVFLIWYQWASLIKRVLGLNIIYKTDDNRLFDYEYITEKKPVIFFKELNISTFFLISYNLAPSIFVLTKESLTNSSFLISYFFKKLNYLIQLKNGNLKKYPLIMAGQSKQIEEYFLNNAFYIKRINRPIALIFNSNIKKKNDTFFINIEYGIYIDSSGDEPFAVFVKAFEHGLAFYEVVD